MSLIHLLFIPRTPAEFLSISKSKLKFSSCELLQSHKLTPTAFVLGKENAEMHVAVVA